MKHGKGVYTWTSGNIYKGDYFEDERHGNGQMLWTDGSLYEGEWVNGIQHGLGRMVFPDGTIKEGLFENNVYKKPWPQPGGQNILIKQDQHMRSTKASSGFQQSDQKKNPYHLNVLNQYYRNKTPLVGLPDIHKSSSKEIIKPGSNIIIHEYLEKHKSKFSSIGTNGSGSAQKEVEHFMQ